MLIFKYGNIFYIQYSIAGFPWELSSDRSHMKDPSGGRVSWDLYLKREGKKDKAEGKPNCSKGHNTSEKDQKPKRHYLYPLCSKRGGISIQYSNQMQAAPETGMVLSGIVPSRLWQFRRTEAFPTTGGNSLISEGKSECYIVSRVVWCHRGKPLDQIDTILRSVSKHWTNSVMTTKVGDTGTYSHF